MRTSKLIKGAVQTRELPRRTTAQKLRGEVQSLLDFMEAQGGHCRAPQIKVNHGPGSNQYGPRQNGIGEGIWVQPLLGDDEDGIGFLLNDSFNHGRYGDLVQYGTYNPENNPVILLVADGQDIRNRLDALRE